jgi:hypothetical protein
VAARRRIPLSVQKEVRQRAAGLCEYCHTQEAWQYVLFTIDHIIPLSTGGADTIENLALACFHCNRRIANKLFAADPVSDQKVSIFNPRQDSWSQHFIWAADRCRLIGLSATARATIDLLTLNRLRLLHIRAADVAIGRHPPTDDPIQTDDPSHGPNRQIK